MSEYWLGKRVRLRATEPSDAEHFFLINRERDVDRNLQMVWPPASLAAQQKFVEEAAHAGFTDGHNFRFQIETIESGQHIGSIDTHHCDTRVGKFEYGISVREQYRGRGYASEAVLLVLRYYFQELRYQKCDVGVYEFNESSIRMHEKLGFVEEGRRRRATYSRGEYHDMLLFGITVEEFREKHPEYANL